MAVRKGLGRGLDALLDPYMEEDKSSNGVQSIDIQLIDTNKQQPRKNFNEEKLKELSASIEKHGIIQPLLVKKKNDRYIIVAGERRFRAARMAKCKEVPVLVVDYNDAKMQEVALIENIQREDLNPIEEATAIKFLMQQHDMTQEEVSDSIGRSRPAVANSLRLLQLPEKILEMLKDGSISAGHGRALAGLSDADLQNRLADECVRLGYSVRALESRIKGLSEAPKAKKEKAELSPDLKELQESMTRKTGTKVRIDGSEEKGKITIDYYTKEDLNNIFEMITK